MDREAWQQFMESQRVGHDLVTKHTSTTRKTGGRSNGDASCPTNLPESSPLESILAEPWGRAAPWVPLADCSQPGGPFPTEHLALSAHVSPQTIRF